MHKKDKCVCGGMKDVRSKTCMECRPKVKATDQEIELCKQLLANSISIREVARQTGKSHTFLTALVERESIDISHMSWFLTEETALADRSDVPYAKRRNATVKKFLLQSGCKPYVCECGQKPEWNGRELSLELDHINGNPLDDRIENLRFLCPNCHSQTDTWKWKNRKDRNHV